LKSGKEGVYKELENHTEEKMLSLLSDNERKKILRLRQVPSATERSDAEVEINSWLGSISQVDKDISFNLKKSTIPQKSDIFASKSLTKTALPPVRGSKQVPLNDEAIKKMASTNKNNSISDDRTNKTSAVDSRLSGYDFRAWEKYDVDNAIKNIEEEESEMNNKSIDANNKMLNNISLAKQESKKRRDEAHKKELDVIRNEKNNSTLSDTERKILAGNY
jgi:hypothetical protein